MDLESRWTEIKYTLQLKTNVVDIVQVVQGKQRMGSDYVIGGLTSSTLSKFWGPSPAQNFGRVTRSAALHDDPIQFSFAMS